MLLEQINSPKDIKNFSQKQIEQLEKECRKTIIEVVGKNGGHLASNLGVVELTIALHRVFESPKDAIIWDVSHQCYTHKLLTGRYKSFKTLRQKNGISGFTNKNESEHDFFINGHSSTSISQALGLLSARELNHQEGKVIAVIGDGALTGGLAFEGLSNAGQLSKNLIVVLNDNQMSIDHNTGSISRYLSRLTTTSRYQNFRNSVDKLINHIPYLGKWLEKFIFRFKRSLKGLFLTNNLFVDLGFEYTGPLDGHNEVALEKAFRRVKKLHRPVVVHIVTKKGKGYSPAENNPEKFHGIGPFLISDGTVEKFDTTSFTEAFSKIIVEEAEKNPKIVAITAAMSKGTGLSSFAHKFPNRFFDVGIAEEHAVTFAGGLAFGGCLPVVCIYSTFFQRSIDQIICDVAIQNLHVIFMLDRAGAVPNDGITHQGIFDIALLKPIPKIVIMSPVSEKDLRLCFLWAEKNPYATVIRYPKLSCPTEHPQFSVPVEIGRGIFISCSEFVIGNILENDLESAKKKVLVVCTGGIFSEVAVAIRSVLIQDGYADLYILRFIKPFDSEYFLEIAKKYDAFVIVEDGVLEGGVSTDIKNILLENNLKNVSTLGFKDKYLLHGSRNDVLEATNLTSKDIEEEILKWLR